MVKAWTASLRSAYPEWGRERWQRRLEKKLRKRAEREAKIANASLFEGYLWVLGAVVMFILALSAWPVLLWLLFPAAALGSRGTRVIARHVGATRPNPPLGMPGIPTMTQSPIGAPQQQQAPNAVDAMDAQARARAQRFGSLGDAFGTLQRDLSNFGQNLRDFSKPANLIDGANTRGAYGGAVGPAMGAPAAADPRDVRVDAIAEKILAELRDSPQAVREIFRKPEQTIHALRDTCKDLTRRERDVRRFLSPEEDARLNRERDALQKRVDGEVDEVVKSRLGGALAALDQQRAQRAELARSAARFEAEHTRISYTMESLYTQVVRMRSADAGSVDVAGAGLRRSLDLLSQEANALADALERVNVGTHEQVNAAGAIAAQTTPSQPPPSRSEADRLKALADAEKLKGVADAPGSITSAGVGVPQREKA